MVQPAVRILSTADAQAAARELESPREVEQFKAMAAESGSVRAFLDTPEWAAIYQRIMGDGKPPTGRPRVLADVSRYMRWTADGLMGSFVDEKTRSAYLHCALEVDTFARSANRAAMVAAAAPAGKPGISFGAAMSALKAGSRVRRSRWAAGVYVTMQAGYPDGIGVNANTAAATGLVQGSTVAFAPYLMQCVRPAADGQPPMFAPWTPNQEELFAEDWILLVEG